MDKKYKFDELDDEIRDEIIEDLKEYSAEVDNFIFSIAKSYFYDKDGDRIRKIKEGGKINV